MFFGKSVKTICLLCVSESAANSSLANRMASGVAGCVLGGGVGLNASFCASVASSSLSVTTILSTRNLRRNVSG